MTENEDKTLSILLIVIVTVVVGCTFAYIERETQYYNKKAFESICHEQEVIDYIKKKDWVLLIDNPMVHENVVTYYKNLKRLENK